MPPPPLPADATTTLALPTGNFAIFAKASMDDIPGSSQTPQCLLTAGTDVDSDYVTLPGTVGGWERTVMVAHRSATAGSVTLALTTPSGSMVRCASAWSRSSPSGRTRSPTPP